MAVRPELILILAVLSGGCGPRIAQQVQVPEAPPAPVPVLPSFPKTAPILTAEIPSQIPSPPPRLDAVGLSIAEARLHFDRGLGFYDTGYLKQARAEFDTAIDVLLESSSFHPRNDRIQSEMTSMVNRVHLMEMESIRSGDGFAVQDGQHAAIDDLEQLPTFPAPIDPKLKQVVEDSVRKTVHDLPIEITGRVLSALEYFQNGRGRSTMSVGLERAGLYRPMMERILAEENVPQDLIFLAQAESAFLPRAISRAKARGLWQFISSRGKEYGLRQTWWLDERSDPEKATRAAARHLRDLYDQFHDWYLAMAAYNSGPMRVERAMKKTGATTFWQLADKKALPKETINYVPTILAFTIIGRNPDQYGFSVEPAPALATERVQLDQATDLRVIAEALDVPLETLKELNPHILRWTTPPDDPEFELILPRGSSERFVEKVAAMPASERVLWRHHDVKRGETLSVIAQKYGVSVNDLTQANNIGVKSTLRIGQEILIPMSGATKSVARVAAAAAPSAKPMPSFYTVRRGDTLSGIAATYKVTVTDLKKWNNLTSSRLVVGQKLRLGEGSVRQAN